MTDADPQPSAPTDLAPPARAADRQLAAWQGLRRGLVLYFAASAALAVVMLAWSWPGAGLAPGWADTLPLVPGVALLTLLLSLLAPTLLLSALRSLQNQMQRLSRQAADLDRRAAVAEHTTNLVIITDHKQRLVWANEAFTRLTGYELHEVSGRPALGLLLGPGADANTLARVRLALDRGQPLRAGLLNRSRDGRDYEVDSDLQPLRNAAGELTGFAVVQTVVTGQVGSHPLATDAQRPADEIDRQAAMPRGFDRGALLEHLQRAIVHRSRHPTYGFALLLLDVDGIGQVNDSLGRDAGDEVLRQLNDRLQQALRPGDAMARLTPALSDSSRIGGDEFVVVLEGVARPESACQVSTRLLELLSQPWRWGTKSVPVRLSMGIVHAEQAGTDAEVLLADACTAMVEAQRAGGGRWMVFDAAMHQRANQAHALEADLRQAIDDEQLHLVYQPLVALGDRRLTGVEALLRWRHPERGEILPASFIDLAEQTGLIDDIGDRVLHLACAQFAAWQRHWGRRAPPMLVLNLSPVQLRQPGLAHELVAVLDANGMQPAQLQLDLGQVPAVPDAQLLASLRALKAADIQLALDDFGSAGATLASLQQLPLDIVKIDRAFVAQADAQEHHRVLISATVQMARALTMTTLAKGIETAEQAALMAALGCDHGQGWLYGRPMTAAALDRWIEHEASDSLV